MKWSKFLTRSIALKATSLTMLFCTVFVVVTAAINVALDISREKTLLKNRILQIKTVDIPSLTASVWNFDEHQIKIQIKGLLHIQDVSAIALKTADGTLYTEGVSIPEEHAYVHTFPLTYLKNGNTNKIGELRIFTNKKAMLQRTYGRLSKIMLYQLLQIFLIAGFMLLIVDRLFVRPLNRIAVYAGNLDLDSLNTSLDPDRRWITSANDEMGRVISKLNDMRSRLIENLAKRREMEESLKESESFRKRVFDSSRVPIVIMDAETNQYIECNEAAVKIYHFATRDQVIGKTPLDFSAPMQYDGTPSPVKAQYYINKAVADGSVVFEWRHERSSGEMWDAEVHLMSFKSGEKVLLQFTLQEITSSKRAERELKKSEEKFRTYIDRAPDGVVITNHAGHILETNSSFGRLTGFSAEDVKSLTISSIVAPESKIDGENHLRNVFETGTATADLWHIIKDGSRRCFTVDAVKLSSDRILGFLKNITEKKIAEEAQKETEAKFALAFRSAPYAMSITRPSDGRIIDVNDNFASMTGYSTEEIIGRTMIELKLWIDIDERERLLKELKRNGILREVECIFRRKSGELFPALLSAGLINLNGTGYLISSTIDITERKRAERSIIESEERFRQMAENIEEVFFLYQKDGNKLLYMSPVVSKLFGVNLQSLQADPLMIDRAVHPDDLPFTRFTDSAIFYSTPLNEEFRIITPGNVIRWIRLRSFLIHDEAGSVVRVAGLVADITEHKIAAEKERLHAEQLQQADKMASLGVLVSGVAHEINNPNNFIMLNTPLLKDAWEQARPILETHFETAGEFELGGIPFSEMKNTIPSLFQGIEDGSLRIKKIVEDLKNFARKDVLHYENDIDVIQAVNEAVSLLSSMIRKKTNKFTLALPNDPIRIKGNKQKLEQVLINLIHNACDALETQEQLIEVRVERYTSECTITVTDQGKGISKSDLPHITEPFFTSKRDLGGTGLGLSVSAGIIKDHNGKLLFESELGAGTKATIVLPIHSEKEP